MEKKAGPGLISPGLIAAQVKKTVQEVSSLAPKEAVSFREAPRHLNLFLALVLAWGKVIFLDPQFLNRSLALVMNPLSSLFQRATSISVELGESILLRRKPFTIRARATGIVPQKLSLLIRPQGGGFSGVLTNQSGFATLLGIGLYWGGGTSPLGER